MEGDTRTTSPPRPGGEKRKIGRFSDALHRASLQKEEKGGGDKEPQ